MTTGPAFVRFMSRHRAIAAATYIALVLTFLAIAASALSSLTDQRATVQAAADMLAQLQARETRVESRTVKGPAPAGAAFLEGPTATVAAASLLQRVASAVTRLGGNVVSSQTDIKDGAGKDNSIGLIASCEIDQAALQELLYDLEAGMPFLFIDQLVVQSSAAEGTDAKRLRVLLSVNGQWEAKP